MFLIPMSFSHKLPLFKKTQTNIFWLYLFRIQIYGKLHTSHYRRLLETHHYAQLSIYTEISFYWINTDFTALAASVPFFFLLIAWFIFKHVISGKLIYIILVLIIQSWKGLYYTHIHIHQISIYIYIV